MLVQHYERRAVVREYVLAAGRPPRPLGVRCGPTGHGGLRRRPDRVHVSQVHRRLGTGCCGRAAHGHGHQLRDLLIHFPARRPLARLRDLGGLEAGIGVPVRFPREVSVPYSISPDYTSAANS